MFNVDNQRSFFTWYGSVAGTSCPSMYLSGMLTGVMRIYTPLSHSLPFCLLPHSVMAPCSAKSSSRLAEVGHSSVQKKKTDAKAKISHNKSSQSNIISEQETAGLITSLSVSHSYCQKPSNPPPAPKNTTERTKPRAVGVYETLNRLILDCSGHASDQHASRTGVISD